MKATQIINTWEYGDLTDYHIITDGKRWGVAWQSDYSFTIPTENIANASNGVQWFDSRYQAERYRREIVAALR